MGKRLRVGILGCGDIAFGKHMPAMREAGCFDIAAFYNRSPEKAERARREYGCEGAKVCSSCEELLEEPLDAVYVLTPNSSHASLSIAAMEAGKHVMCEKPMAVSFTEALAMVETSRRTGRLLTVAYQNRFRPDARYLKRLCEDGELGEIYYARAHAVRRRAVPTWGSFLNRQIQGGGPLIDIGTHALDLTLWMMDNYEPEMAVGSVYRKLADQTETGNLWGDWDPASYTVEDSAFGFVRMRNGATIILESSWALNTLDVGEAQTTLCGTLAGADMQDGLRINRVHHNLQCVERPETGKGYPGNGGGNEANVLEQKAFYEAVVNGTGLVVKPEQALVVTRILDAIYESGRTGKPVFFD